MPNHRVKTNNRKTYTTPARPFEKERLDQVRRAAESGRRASLQSFVINYRS